MSPATGRKGTARSRRATPCSLLLLPGLEGRNFELRRDFSASLGLTRPARRRGATSCRGVVEEVDELSEVVRLQGLRATLSTHGQSARWMLRTRLLPVKGTSRPSAPRGRRGLSYAGSGTRRSHPPGLRVIARVAESRHDDDHHTKRLCGSRGQRCGSRWERPAIWPADDTRAVRTIRRLREPGSASSADVPDDLVRLLLSRTAACARSCARRRRPQPIG